VRTYSPKAHELQNDWLVIDATDVVLGRLAATAAALLRGKHKATFAPHMDNGDFVVIITQRRWHLPDLSCRRRTHTVTLVTQVV